jgi:hypothetical protein
MGQGKEQQLHRGDTGWKTLRAVTVLTRTQLVVKLLCLRDDLNLRTVVVRGVVALPDLKEQC